MAICQQCGDEFDGLHKRQKFCGKICREGYYAEYQLAYHQRTKSVKIEKAVRVKKVKPVIETNADQQKIRDALNRKWAMPPSEVKHYKPGDPEFDEIAKQCVPMGEIRDVPALYGLSGPFSTYTQRYDQ